MADNAPPLGVRDLKIPEAHVFDNSYSLLSASLHTPELRPWADAFAANVNRATALTILPTVLVTLSMHSQEQACRACFEVTGKLNMTEDDTPHIDAVRKRFDELMALAINDPVLKNSWWIGVSNLINLANIPGSPVLTGLDAVLSGQIIWSWTAFESAATDLWVAAVNLRPDPLALGAIGTQLKPDEEVDDASTSQPPTKSAKLKYIESLLHEEQTQEYGSLIKKAAKFDFSRLWGIREAYRCVFGADAESMFLRDEFSDLTVLEGIRNVLVHRGGRVDGKYRMRVKKSTKQYEKFGIDQLAINDPIVVDGFLAGKMTDGVVKSVSLLFSLVDKWFANHPPSKK